MSHSVSDNKRTKKRWIIALSTVLVLLLVLGGAGAYLWGQYGDRVSQMLGWTTNDFEGQGHGEAIVTIREGDIGEDVARTLADAGVVKTSQAFYELLLAQDTPVEFQIGSYRLKLEMSAQAALDALQDETNKVELTVVLPEGISAMDALSRAAEVTGLPLSDFEAAAKNPTNFGVPADFPSLEGFLFPATYVFEPNDTPDTIIQKMVDRMKQALAEHGVPESDSLRVLTLASIVQKEAGNTEDMPMISRVFLNRIDIGMHLQSDATVSYGTGNPDNTVWTSDAEREDASNQFNTYANPGLPIGPIGLPGDAAIDAAMHPADGPWIFFTAIDLENGITAFASDEAGHQANVAKLHEWCDAHESAGGKYCD
jgi:UPF0755 protein